jgi:drug/metabolite transporter (DMT)-like permease
MGDDSGTSSKFMAILLSILGFFVAGAGSVLYMRGFSMMKARGRSFEHPFFTCLLMFIGEYAILMLFYITKKFGMVYKAEEGLPKVNPLILAIPSFLDLLGSTLGFFAMFFLAASVSQMMMSVMMLTTCVLSIIFLKKRYFRQHWTGFLIILVGVTIVATNAVVQSNRNPTAAATNTQPIGIIMYLLSLIIQATQCVTEEIIFRKFTCHPLECVGYEGASGILYYLILLPIFQFINVPKKVSIYGVLENSVEALSQCAANKYILLMVITYPMIIAVLNVSGQGITKYLSALHRTIIAQCRTVLVWVVALIIGWEKFYVLQLVGFAFVIFGSLLYNEIIVLPCGGFNLYTKKALAAKAREGTQE